MLSEDEKYMRRCLQLAANGIQGARPNPMVGAVISLPPAPSKGRGSWRIIGEGYHVRCGQGHAEVNAFASVKPEDELLLKDATIYVSLEPCSHYGKTPPCADLIIKKGVRRVVVGTIDPFAEVQGRGIKKLQDAGIDVTVGVLEKECQWLNRRFLRAEEDAILVGHTTDVREHPQLTVRHWHGPNPKRVVLTHQRPLSQLIDDLYQQGIQSLIVEGGRQTHESFLAAGLWDEIRVETGTVIVSDGTRAPQVPANVTLLSSADYDVSHLIMGLRKLWVCSQRSARRII